MQLLAEQVEYLRLLLGQSTTTVARALTPAGPELEFSRIPVEEQVWVSEEEEDLKQMFESGVLSEDEYHAQVQIARQHLHLVE